MRSIGIGAKQAWNKKDEPKVKTGFDSLDNKSTANVIVSNIYQA